MIDEAIIRPYHLIARYSPLFFDATGTVTRAIPWLKNKNDNLKRMSLYMLVIAHPCGNFLPTALVNCIASEHNLFSIQQSFLRMKELKQKTYGSGSNTPSNIMYNRLQCCSDTRIQV